MASHICEHDKNRRRPFKGMQRVGFTPDAVEYRCDRCGLVVMVARCTATTTTYARQCRAAAFAEGALCILHAGKAKR